jgi:curved DNA-binding protein CbpA
MTKDRTGTTPEGTVNSMTTGPGGPPPDLYQVLGVGPAASGEEITRAWRQRARAEHPDARPRDAAAPARFRVLAEAYRVLGDPARRAAYDQAAGRPPRPRPAAPGPQGRGRPPAAGPPTGAPGAPLRAGPVRVEAPGREPTGSRPAPRPAPGEEELLAWLVLRYLAGGRERPW